MFHVLLEKQHPAICVEGSSPGKNAKSTGKTRNRLNFVWLANHASPSSGFYSKLVGGD